MSILLSFYKKDKVFDRQKYINFLEEFCKVWAEIFSRFAQLMKVYILILFLSLVFNSNLL